MSSVPEIRIQDINGAPVRPDGGWVLYWMIAFRRLEDNFALQRAVDLCRELGKPLVVLEPLRCDYRWASPRFHRFLLEGMAEHRDRLAGSRVLYHPYVEPEPGAGKGLLEALARNACALVTDDYPCFFLPRMVEAAGEKVGVRLEMVDSNGLLPLRAAGRVFPKAHSLRAFLQKNLGPHLREMPREHPLMGSPLPAPRELPGKVGSRWPAADLEDLLEKGGLDRLPLDHSVPVVEDAAGGGKAAGRVLDAFLEENLDRYGEGRNHPDDDSASGLSPWLHFGHLSSHTVLRRIAGREGWSPDDLGEPQGGSRHGWWGLSESIESFLDELVTWRELGYNMAWQRDDYHRYRSLPDWARETLEEHEEDERPHLYERAVMEEARTEDPVWNAAQRELRRRGRVHNYLRMLWGKKTLEWTPSAREASELLIELNNRWALDGRDPNSYSGIFWCFGRYDRAWGPERPIYGKVRYMTSESTRRKLRMKRYLERYGPEGDGTS